MRRPREQLCVLLRCALTPAPLSRGRERGGLGRPSSPLVNHPGGGGGGSSTSDGKRSERKRCT